jgi:hypothetical protein
MKNSAEINILLRLIESSASFARGGTVASLVQQLEDLQHTISKTLREVQQHHLQTDNRKQTSNLW